MARKIKGQLPSGNIRVRVLDYKDADGKYHYKSFTADSKKEAEALAAEYLANKKNIDETSKTLSEEIQRYITLKNSVLSPSTIRNYKSIAKVIDGNKIANLYVNQISSIDIQEYVSTMSIGNSKKTTKNHVGLIVPAIQLTRPDFSPKLTYKQDEREDFYCPDNSDIQKLINCCETNEEKLGILFGAIGFMRRSEACAVTFKDVDFDKSEISINKAMVMDENNAWVIKTTKTTDSTRKVMVSADVMSLIKAINRRDGYVLNTNPLQLHRAFKRVLKASGVHPFRYHDLRHHAASYAHSIGIPDRFIEKMGGWKPNSTVLRRVYQNVIDSEFEKNKKLFLKKSKFVV